LGNRDVPNTYATGFHERVHGSNVLCYGSEPIRAETGGRAVLGVRLLHEGIGTCEQLEVSVFELKQEGFDTVVLLGEHLNANFLRLQSLSTLGREGRQKICILNVVECLRQDEKSELSERTSTLWDQHSPASIGCGLWRWSTSHGTARETWHT
jgi:hypothetical protein